MNILKIKKMFDGKKKYTTQLGLRVPFLVISKYTQMRLTKNIYYLSKLNS